MKQTLVSFSLFLFCLGVSGIAQADSTPQQIYQEGIKAYADLLKAQAEYRRVLIEAQLADSKIRLANAEAEYKETLAAGLRVQIQAMTYELNRIISEDIKLGWKIKEVEDHAHCLSHLNMGNVNHSIVYYCLLPFLRTYVPATLLREVVKVTVPPIGVEQLRANDESSYLEPFPGGNMGQFMEFLGEREISVVRWSEAHFLFLDMMNHLGAQADLMIQKYQAYLIGIRSGTLNIWTLPRS